MIKAKIVPALLAGWLLAGCQTLSISPTLEISDPGPAECQHAVIVEVWGDLNADGIKDAGEPLLPDVLVVLALKSDPGAGSLQMKTGDNGRAYFPTRELVDCRVADYHVLFAKSVTGYEFPENPLIPLTDFTPQRDIIQFGLVPTP